MTWRWVAGMAAAGVLVSAPPRASACGGFFCQSAPVVQAAEEIVYVVEDDGALTMSVRILYQGTAEEFAWILPVPSEPTLSLGSTAIFDALEPATRPRFTSSFRVEGTCATPPRCEYRDTGPVWTLDAAASDAAAPWDVGGGPGVVVRGALGPFETVIIGDGTGTEIQAWLTANGYDIPVESVAILDEYLEGGSLFVALRLRPDAAVDNIQPITLHFSEPTEPCLPIRLTRIATTGQLPILTYFLASERATPRNYSLIEDFDNFSLYDAVGGQVFRYRAWASSTIDVAGGHAFVADYAGVTPTLEVSEPPLGEPLRAATPQQLLAELYDARGGDAEALALLNRFLVAPADVEQAAFVSCLRFDATGTCGTPVLYDPSGYVDAFAAEIVAPRAAAQGWLDDHAYATRLYTEMSAEEMTFDPEFVLDDGLGDQPRDHTAAQVVECGPSYYDGYAPVRVDYDGRITERVGEGETMTAAVYCTRRGGWLEGTTPPPVGGMDGGVGATPGGSGGCHVARGRSSTGMIAGLALLALMMRRRARR